MNGSLSSLTLKDCAGVLGTFSNFAFTYLNGIWRNLNKNTVNKFVVAALTGAALLAGISCHRNPITGRSQLTLVSEKQVQALALTEYQKFLSSNKVVAATNEDGEMVKRVGRRIADAIGQYYSDHGAPDALKGYAWEFNLVESREINAWWADRSRRSC
jgi:hypothetical protein